MEYEYVPCEFHILLNCSEQNSLCYFVIVLTLCCNEALSEC